MTTVFARDSEPVDQLLRRFRRQVQNEGILTAVRRRRFFVPKSELRRKAQLRAVRRARRQLRRYE
jgi:small subunit ribosomal protein S21